MDRFGHVQFEEAAKRLAGVVERTPLNPFSVQNDRLNLKLKLECQQVTGSFKARGAWNQVSQLTETERSQGVVATSSGNHARALAWAAKRANVSATLFMPADAYENKVQACRDEGAEVDIAPTRMEAEARCAARVEAGAILIHPYNAWRTVEGAGTVGLEIATDWPEVDVVVVPVGGGGLIAGTSLALKRFLGEQVKVVGVEPSGSATMTRALEAGAPVDLKKITTEVQGLCPLNVGDVNLEVACVSVDKVAMLNDRDIFGAQRRLLAEGIMVEPAGAATLAGVMAGIIPEEWYPSNRPLNVCCVVSGGNAAPEQLVALQDTGNWFSRLKARWLR